MLDTEVRLRQAVRECHGALAVRPEAMGPCRSPQVSGGVGRRDHTLSQAQVTVCCGALVRCAAPDPETPFQGNGWAQTRG